MRAESDGGRHHAFLIGYSPHLAVPPDATLLGVRLFEIEDPEGYRVVRPGTTAKVLLQLIYHPHIDYSALIEGAEFNIQEGLRVVGTGRVIERK